MEEIASDETNLPSIPFWRSTYHEGDSVFDLLDDARREIAYAMQVHRSSPLISSCVTEKEPNVAGNIFFSHEINSSMFSDAKYCYSILEAMPLPGPTWSTTAPSVLAEEPPSAPIDGSLELDLGENQASSYTWWLEFLESLDDNMTSENLDHPFVENIEIENSKMLSLESSSFVDSIDLSCCPDDWLMIPPMEKGLGDMVMP